MSQPTHDLEIHYTMEYPDQNQIDMGELTLNFSLNLASHLFNEADCDLYELAETNWPEELTLEEVESAILKLLEDNIAGSWKTWDYVITPAIDLEELKLHVKKQIEVHEHWDWVDAHSGRY